MKIIVIDKVHDVLFEMLRNAGFEVDDYRTADEQTISNKLKDYEGIVIRSKIKLTADLLSTLPRLRFIARVGSGLESIDVDFAQKNGIVVLNSPEGNRDSVGEHTVGLILSLLHKIAIANYQVKAGIWDRDANRCTELQGKTVGIIGYGNMGSVVAKQLSSFDVNVLSYDKYKTNYSDGYTTEVDMHTIFENVDILTLHVPLQADTFYLVDETYIHSFRKPFYLINTARGKVVKTTDLVKNLKSGKVLGAGLDVLEYENISFEKLSFENNPDIQYLQNAPNVILTPHIAGVSYESALKLAKVTASKIIKHFAETT